MDLNLHSQKSKRAIPVLFAIALLMLFISPSLLFAQSGKEAANLDGGLRQLVRLHKQSRSTDGPELNLKSAEQLMNGAPNRRATGVFRMHVDRSNRVLVNVTLDGTVPLDVLSKMIANNKSAVVAATSDYRKGKLSAFVPVDGVESLARTAGVRAVTLAHRPQTNAGIVTSQGAALLRSDIINQLGIDGTGVTVGILSDSFNTSSGFGVFDTAALDVATGDLPGTTAIPGGEGLKFLIELNPDFFGPFTDEGRAMAQIVHDIAPGADLCFATAFISEVSFSVNIRLLRAHPACNADVIIDDTVYEDEPFFSDGMIAEAVNDVATSTTLPGRKVAYFSSAGNSARHGYSSELRIVSDKKARAIPASALGVNLSTIPPDIDTSGGFHNFATFGQVRLAQDFLYADETDFSFQWDDPFDLEPSGITTDLNLLFFDQASGEFLFAVNDDNFETNRAIENFQLITGDGPGTVGRLLMVIARTGVGTHRARRVKYVVFGGFADLSGFSDSSTPLTFGHNSAREGNGVAATSYAADPGVFGPPAFNPHYEPFSSPGPVIIAFDQNGNRLAQPEIRLKPDFAAPDGVNTTFFPEPELFGPADYEAGFGIADGLPNFFGTSASVAHAGAVGALIIQKAGGPGSISPRKVGRILKQSAPPRSLNVSTSAAVVCGNGAAVEVIANGDSTSSKSSTFFTVVFDSIKKGQTLSSITIDLSGTGLVFFPASFPLTVGSSTGPLITSAVPAGPTSVLTINFSGFTSDNAISFGIDRDFVTKQGVPIPFTFGKFADQLAGAHLVAVVSSPSNPQPATMGATFQTRVGTGYRGLDGFGLIDAANAIQLTK
jgi:hypothetical protein